MCDLHGKFGSPECERCIAAKCCDKVTACANDPSCAAMQSCALGCLLLTDSSGCYSQCVPKYPDGQTLWQPVATCQYGTPVEETCRIPCTRLP